MLPFLIEEKKGLRTQVTFTGTSLEIYVPSYFFDNDLMARVIGSRIESIGLFWFKTNDKFYELQIPVKISFEFTERQRKTLRLQPKIPSLTYEVFELTTGDAFLYDIAYKESIDDIDFFFSKLIENAKMPPTVAYDESLNIFLKALEATKINEKFGVGAVTLEFLLSEAYRDRKNNSKPFRLTYDGKRGSPYDYRMVRMVKIPELNSSFTGLTGEDVNHQLVSAILRSRQNKKERYTPIEDILKY